MREQERRRLDAAGRGRMRSPGRPPAGRREERQRFRAAIAGGLPGEDAAVVAGVSPAVGTRWFVRLVACRRSLKARCRGATCP
jgi:hypothetical protein